MLADYGDALVESRRAAQEPVAPRVVRRAARVEEEEPEPAYRSHSAW